MKTIIRKILAIAMMFALIVQYSVGIDSLFAYADENVTEIAQDESINTESAKADADADTETQTEEPSDAEDSSDEADQIGSTDASDVSDAADSEDNSEDEVVSEAASEDADASDATADDAEANATEEVAEEVEEAAEDDADKTIKQTAKVGGAVISAEYKKSAFDGDVTFKADILSKKQMKKNSEAVDELVGEDGSAIVIFAFDLYFMDESGKRLEPSDDVKISIDFDKAQNKGVPGELRVVHVDHDGTAEYVKGASVSDDAKSTEFTSDSFSEYDVIAANGSVIPVSTSAELNTVIADLNSDGGEKFVELTDDVVIASSAGFTFSKGKLTILGGDHKLTGYINTKNDAELSLGMDGYSKKLQFDSKDNTRPVVELTNSAVLKIYDGTTIGPSLSGGTAGGVQAREKSHIYMYGGTITDCESRLSTTGGVLIDNSSVFDMYDGTITNCKGVQGGGVCLGGGAPIGGTVGGTATFNMHGGTISNCTDSYIGGGAVCAYTAYPVKFYMDGGTITGCSSTSYGYGSAICFYTGADTTFIMNGGKITGNTGSGSRYGYGGGIFIYPYRGQAVNIQLNGGSITNNTAKIGGGIMAFGGSFSVADGFGLHNNTASGGGDDIYNVGASITLGKADTSATLESTGLGITGWYYDGTPDEESVEARWSWDPATPDTNYTKEFKSTSVTTECALKAAHGDPEYTVTFDPDGGSPDPDDQKVKHNEKATKPATDPAKTGYTFAGWYKVVGGTMEDEKFDFDTIITSDTDLKAKYEPIHYKVEFKANGGSGTMSDEEFAYDETKALTTNAFTRSGYTYTGWNTKSDGSGTGYVDEAEVSNLTTVDNDTITLYAQWTPNDSRLTYNANGGEGTTKDTVGKTDQTVQTASNGFTRTGYTFDKWNSEADGSGTNYAEGADFVLGAEPTTLYAQWTPIKYTVKFDSNGGSAAAEQTVDYGSTVKQPANPTRSGYTFGGWLLNGEPYDFSTPITGDITLTASWTQNPAPVEPDEPDDPEQPDEPDEPTVVPDDDDDPTPARPARAAAPAAPAATPAAQPTINDDPVPQTEPETIPDDEPPMVEPEGNWALLNLIAAALTTIGAIVALARKREDDDDEDDDDEEARAKRRLRIAKIVGLVLAAISIIVFILTEDISLTMELVDKWTILMALLFLGQIISAIVAKNAADAEYEEEEE